MRDQRVSPEAHSHTATAQRAPAAASPAPAGATAVQRIAAGFDGDAFIDALTRGDLDAVLRAAAADTPHALGVLHQVASHWTNWVMPSTIHSWGDEFYALLERSHPIVGAREALLRRIYLGSSLPDKQRLFEAQFSVKLSPAWHLRGGTTALSESQLDQIYQQALLLPPGHVIDNPEFNTLKSNAGGVADGTHMQRMLFGLVGGDVELANTSNGAWLAEVFRHEVGHAVDAHLGSAGEDFRHNQAGWQSFSASDWIARLGGFNDLPEDLRSPVHNAVSAYFGSGGTFNAPTPTFEATLVQALKHRDMWHLYGIMGAPSDADVSKLLVRIRPHYASNAVLRATVASQGNNNYWRFTDWSHDGGNAYFINHYYAKGYTLKTQTYQHLLRWNDSSAAFSDAEWFAELYQTWYSQPDARPTMPAYVQTYFHNVVDAAGKVTGGGGSNPSVPR